MTKKTEKENYYPNSSISSSSNSNGLTNNISNSNLMNLNGGSNYNNNLNGNLRQNLNIVEEVNVTIRRNEKGFGFEVSGGTHITKVNQSKKREKNHLIFKFHFIFFFFRQSSATRWYFRG